jgi:glyoxylase-like metal-dependent hydrolase (beta-lactamase superfamily II)
MEIISGLYRLAGAGRPRNGKDDAAPLLFDCGWPWSGKGLVADLVALGCRPQQIRAIAITHDDIDHTGRLAPLQAVSGATVIAHTAEIARLGGDHWRPLPRNGGLDDVLGGIADLLYAPWRHHPVRVSHPARDGDRLPGGWLVVHTPGHTPGHAAYFHPLLGVAIVGDALGSPRNGRLRAPAPIYAEDMGEAIRSVRKLAELEPAIICFGHGPILRDAAQALRRLASAL